MSKPNLPRFLFASLVGLLGHGLLQGAEGESAGKADLVFAVGNALANGSIWQCFTGTVRQVFHRKDRFSGFPLDGRFLETQMHTSGGDSGGPLFNDRGELLGVTSGTGLNFMGF